jgi:hypothetical protein
MSQVNQTDEHQLAVGDEPASREKGTAGWVDYAGGLVCLHIV